MFKTYVMWLVYFSNEYYISIEEFINTERRLQPFQTIYNFPIVIKGLLMSLKL